MSASTFLVLHAGHMRRLVAWLGGLTYEKGWVVTVKRNDPKRTIPQNDKLRAMEREIAEQVGHDPDEMHEILLARRFGTVRLELGGGKSIERPARRSSSLTTAEMADYITWVQAFAARELGMELV